MFDPVFLKQASEAQGHALAAGESVWISANTGTGKTEVLTRRMLVLLLSDVTLEPRQILALTFTKAGAAEMAARLPKRLADWAAKSDAEIAAEVAGIGLSDYGVMGLSGEETPEAALGRRVRELAQTVRKAPPLVSTIHGLAQQILGRFTLEAGLPADFDVLEDGAQKRMLRDVQHGLLVGVDGALAEHLGVLLDELGDRGWEELTGIISRSWHKLEALVGGQGLAGVLGRLEVELGVDVSGASARPLVPHESERAALERIAKVLPEHAARGVLESPEALVESAWVEMLLNTSSKARKVGGNGALFSKGDAALVDEADIALLLDAAQRAEAQVRMRRVYRGYDVTRSALIWAAAVRGAYLQRKQEHGLVDYADLLDGLERVMRFSDNGSSEWVWYGLDRRFRHLVVDEAQDNNPQQDRIIQWLAKSILSGDVGEGAARTVLAVGDMKQSIFRFQGAVPELFVKLREVLRDWAGGVREVDLTHSFRSGTHVLGLVDKVFEAGDSGEVVVGSDFRTWPAHTAVAAGRASRVELWDIVEKVKNTEVEPWSLPWVRAAAGGHGEDIVCLRKIGEWLKAQVGVTVMPSTGKPLAYDDVMLVVQRNRIAGLAAGVLRGMGLPVASAGGVQPQAVEDAVACVRVIFNTADNLALAQVLKGVRGWDDARLLQLAAKVNGVEDAVWLEAVEGEDRVWLDALVGLAWEAPLAVVQRVIADVGGDMRVFEGLLGWAEGCENLRELVTRLELDELPIAAGSEGVRVLTVHGSKGLQAPLVILPDTMAALSDMRQDKVLWGDGVVLFKQGKGLTELEDGLLEEEGARRKADSLRGLYVAMTRAMDWLVVAGFGMVGEKSDTWWTRVRDGMGDERVVGDTFERVAVREEVLAVPPAGMPGWLVRGVERPLAGEVQSAAQVRGEAVHALLQGLALEADEDVRAEDVRVREALPWLWGKGARSEMAVALPGGIVGRIDRFVEREGVWWVVDFKTGHVPEMMPDAYAQQVRRYVAALRVTWPERVFKAGIVWTATGRLEEIALA
jgi:ATP-dependent helicase/nuclease subunit A